MFQSKTKTKDETKAKLKTTNSFLCKQTTKGSTASSTARVYIVVRIRTTMVRIHTTWYEYKPRTMYPTLNMLKISSRYSRFSFERLTEQAKENAINESGTDVVLWDSVQSNSST